MPPIAPALTAALVVVLAGCAGTAPPVAAPAPDGVAYEQVQVGYGTVARRESTASVGSLSGDRLRSVNARRVEDLLVGRVAGLRVASRRDGSMSMQIRGRNSLLLSTEPLVVIDGIPAGRGSDPLSGLNPSDIERIDVLRDGGSTAVYGSRGANGVILITTRQAE